MICLSAIMAGRSICWNIPSTINAREINKATTDILNTVISYSRPPARTDECLPRTKQKQGFLKRWGDKLPYIDHDWHVEIGNRICQNICGSRAPLNIFVFAWTNGCRRVKTYGRSWSQVFLQHFTSRLGVTCCRSWFMPVLWLYCFCQWSGSRTVLRYAVGC